MNALRQLDTGSVWRALLRSGYALPTQGTPHQ